MSCTETQTDRGVCLASPIWAEMDMDSRLAFLTTFRQAVQKAMNGRVPRWSGHSDKVLAESDFTNLPPSLQRALRLAVASDRRHFSVDTYSQNAARLKQDKSLRSRRRLR